MIQIPQRLLGEALLKSAKKHPSKIAIIVKEKKYSYSQLYKEAETLAQYLISAGIKKGDRIAIYMDNSWPCIVSIYGITITGAVFIVINPQTKADKLQYILFDSSSKILITSENHKKELLQVLQEPHQIQHIIVSGNNSFLDQTDQVPSSSYDEIIKNYKALKNEQPNIIPNDLAALIYTSGSTGFPKGVMMTHLSMVFTTWSLVEYLRLDVKERIILLLPLAFDYGLYQLLMSVTIGGTLIVEQSVVFMASIYKKMQKYKPTIFPGVPTIYAMMIDSYNENGITFDYIKKITNTAALLPVEYLEILKKIFPNALIFKMYGLTECKRVSYLAPELIDLKPASVGKAIPGTEVFLLSPEGNPVPAGQPGILHIRGPHVMQGYLNQEILTKEMLVDGLLPGEKTLRSNDWFIMDDEGYLYFQGRNDDIIKSRGEKVSPVEIENFLFKIKGIKEVAVVGIPDIIMGESIVVFITTEKNTPLTEKDIKKECTAHFESFMVPYKVIFINEMPKNNNTKIDKLVLKKIYSNAIKEKN